MSTADMIHNAGVVTVTCVLLLALAVVVLRLAALPLTLTALALDKGAELAARPLTFNPSPEWRQRR